MNDQYVTAAAKGKTGLFGKLVDRDFARIALAVDPAWVRERVGSNQQAATATGTSGNGEEGTKGLIDDGGGLESGSATSLVTALTGTSIEQEIAVLLAGLARFTADRAKQESLGWGLDTIGTQVCVARDGSPDADLLEEINQQMLRSFCTLARGKRLSGYGAGEGTWNAVRSAVDSDLRDLPGVVAGRLVVDTLRSGDVPDTRTSAAKVTSAARAAQQAADEALKLCEKAGATCAGTKSAVAPALPAGAVEASDQVKDAATKASTVAAQGGSAGSGALAKRLAAGSAAVALEGHDAQVVLARLQAAEKDVKSAADAVNTARAAANAVPTKKTVERAKATAAADAAEKAAGEAEAAWVTLSGDGLAALTAHAARAVQLHGAMVAAVDARSVGQSSTANATTKRVASAAADAVLKTARTADETAKAAAAKAPKNPTLKATAAKAATDLAAAEKEYNARMADTSAALATAANATAKAADAADAVAGDLDVDALRDAFRTAFRRVVDGADPVQGLLDLGTGVGAAAIGDSEASRALRLAACAVSLPGATGAALGSLGETSVTPTSITIALTSAPACRDVVGMPAPAPSGSTDSDAVVHALEVYREVAPFATTYASQWRSLQAAVEAIQADAGSFKDASQALVSFLGRDDLTSKQVDELTAKVEAQVQAGQAVLLKSLDALDAAVGMARTTTEALGRLDVASQYAYEVDSASSILSEIASVSGLVRSVVSGDAAGALTTATPYLEKVCGDQGPECIDRAHEIAGYAGGVAAIAAAKTPDDAAKAIAGVANPPGGWAAKAEDGKVTFGITDLAGLSGGVELRNGANGLVYEHGGAYWAAPTLTLPLGADVTYGWGGGYVSGFISVLDPAAFLQYDPAAGGALPPAKVTTALALGGGIRLAPVKSPFGFGVSYTWRPGLRTASTDPFGPGADAHQVCFGLNVDLSLIHLYTLDSKGK